MKQTVVYLPNAKGFAKELEGRDFKSTVISTDCLTEDEQKGLVALIPSAREKSIRYRLKAHLNEAFVKKTDLILVDIDFLDTDYAQKFWHESNEVYNAVNLVLTKIPSLDQKYKTYLISAGSIDAVDSFYELIVVRPNEAILIKKDAKKEFIKARNNPSIYSIVMYNDEYNPPEITHYEYFSDEFEKITIESSLEALQQSIIGLHAFPTKNEPESKTTDELFPEQTPEEAKKEKKSRRRWWQSLVDPV